MKTFTARSGERQGMALILVVMVLSSMLILGTAFMHNIRLDYDAAVNYARTGQAEIFAMEALHRAMSEVMYDIWGVSEDRAFVCAPEWGEMTGSVDSSKRVVVDTVHMRAAYAVDGQENYQVVAHQTAFRRTLCDSGVGGQWVQTGLRWIYKNRIGLPSSISDVDATDVGIHYGGYYLDEFLPEHTDNADLFQLGLHFNNGQATGRDYANDENEGQQGGSWWSGYYWPERGAGEKAPWDYVDTRISPDSIFHVFRFDLLDPQDWKVHGTGVRQQAAPGEPLPPIGNDNPDFRATHIGVASISTWPAGDTWGGAVNPNQVNNDYRWEIFFNYKPYGTVPAFYTNPDDGLSHHYKEAKWVYVYTLSGDKKVGRYAVTVVPDLGRPNANTLYDGPNWGQIFTTSIDTSKNSAKYLQAIDKGFLPHGDSNYSAPVNSDNPTDPSAPYADVIKAYQNKYSYANCSTWADNTCSRVNEHIRNYGLITTRSELAMLLRKDSFNDPLTDAELSKDARIITSLITTAGYEYLLGPHWEKDRIILDASRPSTQYGATAVYNSADTRMRLASYLNDLKYYWGPDERIPHVKPAPWSWEKEQVYHFTPFHTPSNNNAGNVPDPTPPGFLPTDFAKLSERALRARLSVFSWLEAAQGCFHDYFTVRDLDDQHNLHARWTGSGYQYVNKASYAAYRNDFAQGTMNAQLPIMHKIVQVGRVKPAHPTAEENGNNKDDGFPCSTNNTAPGFDQPEMDTEYYYISLAMSGGYASSKTRAPVPDSQDYRDCKIYVGNTELVNSPDLATASGTLRDSVFVMFGSPDMDGDGFADTSHGDNSGGNDQSRRVDVWAWKDTEGNVRHTVWLAAYESSGSLSPVDSEMQYSYRWGSLVPYLASTDMDTCRGNSGGGTAQRDISSKKAHTMDNPVEYMVVFWKTNTAIDGDTIFYVGSGNVMDSAKLPGNVSSIPLGQAYASIDLFNNDAPESWQLVPATFPWRNYLATWDDTIEGYDPWASNNCQQHWVGGRSPNYIQNMWPEYRRDKYNDMRANSWIAAGQGSHTMIGGNWCIFLDSWTDLRRCPLGFSPGINGGLDALPNTFYQGTPVRYVKSSSTVGDTGDYQVYNPYYLSPINGGGVNEIQSRTLALHYAYDPDLRIWMDLAEVAPINEYFMAGQLTEGSTNAPASAVPPTNKIFAFPVFDAYDNNLDGIVDIPTDQELLGPQLPGGYYISDRKSMSRINLNLIDHPAGVWFMGVGGPYSLEKHQLSVIGRKPLYGYTSLYQFITRTSYGEGAWGSTIAPYNKRVWWHNLYASPVNGYAATGLAQEHIDPAVGWAGNISFIGPSPVFTVYLTAQTIKEDETDPDLVEATSEIKIQATIERTYDGKMNIVEFNWIPQDVSSAQ